jgi:hypothetical protein
MKLHIYAHCILIKLSFTLINVFYYNNQNKPGYIELYIIFIIFINDTEEVQQSQAIDHLYISARRKNLRHLRERFLLVSNSAEPRWRPEIFPMGV